MIESRIDSYTLGRQFNCRPNYCMIASLREMKLKGFADQIADFFGAVAHFAGGLAFHFRAGDDLDGLHHPRGGLFVTAMFQEHGRGADGGDGVDDVFAGVFRALPPIGSNMLTPPGSGLMFPPAATPMPPCRMPARSVMMSPNMLVVTITSKIIGIFHHPHAAGVDVVIVGLHVGEFLGHVLEGPPPKVVPVSEHVGLGHEREPFSFISLAGEIERPADAAFAALAGIDGRLHGDFVGRAFFQKPAHAGVHVFGVFADHDEIDILGLFAGQRRFHAGIQFYRAKVDVLIELESQFQEQTFFQNARGNVGMADRAEEDGRKGFQFLEHGRGQDFAGLQISLAAKVVILGFELKAFQFGDCPKHLNAFGRHFRPGPVSADHRDTQSILIAHVKVPFMV